MIEVPETEWFSAYLDGELTSDEQVRVEQMLAANPQARQLLEDLRTLGATLQSLPPQKLDEDLSLGVLEAAAARMLTAGDSQHETRAHEREMPVIGRSPETLKPWWREISWHRMLGRRAMVWSGIAVAVALMLFFMSPPEHKVNRIAMTEKNKTEPPKSAAAAKGEPAPAPHGHSGGDWRLSRGLHGPDEEQATALGLAKDSAANDKKMPVLPDEAERPEKNGKDGLGASSDARRLTMNKKLEEEKPEPTAVPVRTTTIPHPANEPVPGGGPVAGMLPAGIVAKSDSAPRDRTIRENAETPAMKDGDTRKRSLGAEASDKKAVPHLESAVVDQPAAPANAAIAPSAAGGRGDALGGGEARFGRVTKAAKLPTEPMQPGALKPAATAPTESGRVSMSPQKSGVTGKYGEPGPGPDTSQVASEALSRADSLRNSSNFYNYNYAIPGGGGHGRQNGQVGNNPTPALVVSLDISPAALRQKTFESLLQRLGMVDMQDPVAARRAHSGGYLQQNRLREASPLGVADGRTNPPIVAQGQANLALQPVTGNAINSKAPPTAVQAPAAKKGAENDRLITNAQQSHGGQITGHDLSPGSPLPIVYDIDATSAQLFDVLQRITQKHDTFSPPVIRSAERANDENETARSTFTDRARQQIDGATQAAADATKEQGKNEESLNAAKSRPADSGVGTTAMQRKPAERYAAKQSPVVSTWRMRVVLQVVDPWPKAETTTTELGPATAASTPAALPPTPAKQ